MNAIRILNERRLSVFALGLGWALSLRHSRDERGLSQSTENAILLAGAVAVAGIVIAAITSYVSSHLPR